MYLLCTFIIDNALEKNTTIFQNYYPINYLRNIALENVETGFVFLSDIDFLPGVETYNSIKRSVHSFYDIDVTNKLIIPKLVDQRYGYLLNIMKCT